MYTGDEIVRKSFDVMNLKKRYDGKSNMNFKFNTKLKSKKLVDIIGKLIGQHQEKLQKL
jgi:hypothetical protein